MKNLKLYLLLFLGACLFSQKTLANDVWANDMRALFQANNAIIYAINVRTFSAVDKNNDGIIQEELGESRGNFISAIKKLDALKEQGINTIRLLPITPVGRVKACGTAGSLFAASSFSDVNPQLKAPNSKLTVEEEMMAFVSECHKRNIRVIVDLPCCGAYDLYLKRPELFQKDKNQNPVIVSDWTDVRMFDAGTENQINNDVLNLYNEFIKLMVTIDVDGVIADEANLKPRAFWKKLIDTTRVRNPQFLFLAGTSSQNTSRNSLSKLLEAGFDGYYGGYNRIKDWTKASDLYSAIKSDILLNKKAKTGVLGDFSTHDQISPILVNGAQYSRMILWLNSTLPINSYSIDGFSSGDNYIYFWANKKAKKTFTDDEYYFVHRGQLDIFNFSRAPGGNNTDLNEEFARANRFKKLMSSIISAGTFNPILTSSKNVFAYTIKFDKSNIVVYGNLDFKKPQNVKIFVPKLNNNISSVPIQLKSIPKISNNKISVTLDPGEIQVIFFNAK